MPVGYDLKLSCQKIIYFELHALNCFKGNLAGMFFAWSFTESADKKFKKDQTNI
jgi:hypothetical protein